MKIELFVEQDGGGLQPCVVIIGDPVFTDLPDSSECRCEVAVSGLDACTSIAGDTPTNAVENALLHLQALLDEEGRSKGRRFWWSAGLPYF